MCDRQTSNLEQWQQRYRDSPDTAGAEPEPVVVETAGALPPGRALDLACGAGRNALWLAERGWQVTAVDAAPEAIRILQERAARANLATDTCIADLEAGQFAITESSWDLILAINYLQHDLFGPIQRGLVPGGVAIVVVHLEQPGRASRFAVKPGELARYFEGCEILHDREIQPPDPSRGRALAELVARRPR